MRKNDNFGGREQKSLDALESSIKYVYDSMKPTLDESLKAESVVNDSLGVINNSYANSNDVNNYSSQGQSESRAKVRVLTPNNRPVVKDNYNEVSNNFGSNNYGFNAGYSADNQGFVNPKQSGSAQTLILIFTAILVVMVVLVSLVIMRFLGI